MRCRYFLLVCLAATFVTAQVTVTPYGYATYMGPAVNTLPVWSPLLSTPQMGFVTTSSSPMGATNGTANNNAGATNATLMNVPGPAAASAVAPVFVPGTYLAGIQSPASPAEAMPPETAPGPEGLRLGVAQSNSAYNSYGSPPGQLTVVQAARLAREREQSARNAHVYTDDDLERLKQQGVGLPGGSQVAGPSTLGYTTPTATPNSGGVAGAVMLDRTPGMRPNPQAEMLNRNLGSNENSSANTTPK